MNQHTQPHFLQREFMMLLDAQCYHAPDLYKPQSCNSISTPRIEAFYEASNKGTMMIGHLQWGDSKTEIMLSIGELKNKLMSKDTANCIDKMLVSRCEGKPLIRRPLYIDLNRPNFPIEAVAIIPKLNGRIERTPLFSFPWRNEQEFYASGEPMFSEAIQVNKALIQEILMEAL